MVPTKWRPGGTIFREKLNLFERQMEAIIFNYITMITRYGISTHSLNQFSHVDYEYVRHGKVVIIWP